MFHHVIDDQLELRLLEERHARELFALVDANREHLRAWLPWVDATRSEEEVLGFIRHNLRAFAENRGLAIGVWLGQRLVGVIGVHAIDWANRVASLGYWIAKSSEGKGVMIRSVRALLGHLFAELSLHRIEIRVAPENLRSRAIPERLGFLQEGHLREREWLYDHWVDHLIYALRETEWTSNRLNS